jgi:hypothetical protein
MAMGHWHLVWRLFVVVLREQRAALRGIQLEAKCNCGQAWVDMGMDGNGWIWAWTWMGMDGHG